MACLLMMVMAQAQEITTEKVTITVNTKGQVAIPQALREKLDITPKTKLIVYRKDNQIILEKIGTVNLEQELEEIFDIMDKKGLKLTEEEIQHEIDVVRAENKKK